MCVVIARKRVNETDVLAEREHTDHAVAHGVALAVRFALAFRLTTGNARPQATAERVL